jgi:NADH-quinone oxidoreductase subunit N
LLGVLLMVAGLTFKIAAFPFQVWTPDVYEGAPVPTTAFLAVGSKAAGFALLLRFLFSAAPDLVVHHAKLLGTLAAVTILYGNLCAIPQRNLKRLLGYSSISNAGYLLLGVAALSVTGLAAVLFFLGTYLFAVLAALGVLCVAIPGDEPADLNRLAGLHRRSPFLAATLTLAMVSLAGVPPLAGFMGKLALLSAIIQRVPVDPVYPVLIGVTLVGVVISIYYYFGVIRAIYWSRETADPQPITVSTPMRCALGFCLIALLYLGLAPGNLYDLTLEAASVLKF